MHRVHENIQWSQSKPKLLSPPADTAPRTVPIAWPNPDGYVLARSWAKQPCRDVQCQCHPIYTPTYVLLLLQPSVDPIESRKPCCSTRRGRWHRHSTRCSTIGASKTTLSARRMSCATARSWRPNVARPGSLRHCSASARLRFWNARRRCRRWRKRCAHGSNGWRRRWRRCSRWRRQAA